MSYISFSFFFFVAASLLLYYILPLCVRPYLLLIGSLYFYALSGTENLIWMLCLVALTYLFSRLLEKKQSRALLGVYIGITSLSWLYVKFVNYMLHTAHSLFGTPDITMTVLVPLGVSFFTLSAMGYVIDIYRKKEPAQRNPLKLALFLCYFPTVVQGPISRMGQLSPTLFRGNRFSYRNLTFGAQLALWGLFEKLVIANRAALFSDKVFSGYTQYSGLTVVLGVVLYSVQLYADFAGCVNLCRGVSQMFGVTIGENFDHPYFALSIRDFWRRWHISLSSWLRDYVYIPLGGNRRGKVRKYCNLLCTFLVSGIWHGVGVRYLVWGVYHAVLQIIGELTSKKRGSLAKRLTDTALTSYRIGQRIVTFALVSYGWLIFRADGLRAAFHMTKSLLVHPISFYQLNAVFDDKHELFMLFVSLLVLFAVSYLQRKGSIREMLASQNLPFRWVMYWILLFSVILFGLYGKGYNASDFLYMQF